MSRGALQHNAIRPGWLASRQEAPVDPAQPIIDAHHHLYDRPDCRYLFEDLLADMGCGHDVRATVFVQARAMLRADGPPAMRPVGETEFVNGVAAMSASGLYGPARICAGIVGYADLCLGEAVRPVLQAHIAAAGGPVQAGGRFRGIRQGAAWDPDPAFMNPAYPVGEHMLASPAFRAGYALLGEFGLSFDAWLFFHQIPQLAALARAFPQTPVVLNHCGGILGVRGYSGRRAKVFEQWRASLQELAACPNVMVKLGGLGMHMCGFGFENAARAPSSGELADAWLPWFENCVEAFGAARCMVESNFPVDKGGYGYGIGWNAAQRIFAGATAADKADLFWRSAANFYRLPHLEQP